MKTAKFRAILILAIIASLVAIIPFSHVGAWEAPILFPVEDIAVIEDLELVRDPLPPDPPPCTNRRGDKADVYFPDVAAAADAFPIVAVLQGGLVDKSFYSDKPDYSGLGTQLARFGFVVVIPNHLVSFGPPGTLPVTPFPDECVILDVLAQMTTEDETAKKDGQPNPLFGIIDTERMVLFGHSAGGAACLFAIGGSCQFPFCGPPGLPFPLPDAVRGGAFYGTNTIPLGGTRPIPVNTNEIPVAFVQGTRDSIATLAEALATIEEIESKVPPELIPIIDVDGDPGANHYGVTNENNPQAVLPNFIPPDPDSNDPINISQEESIKLIAQASGEFLLEALTISVDKECLVVPPPSTDGDLCDDFDKPQKLTLQYIGGDANVNSQDSGKVEIIGNPGTTSPVYIIAHNKDEPFKSDAKIWFSGAVTLGETFVINSLPFRDELESNTYVYVFENDDGSPGKLLQSVKFHTSCSQPLLLGDIFGAIQLVGFTDKNGNGSSLPTTEPQFSDNCTIEQPPATDLCDDFDKPQKLTMEYIGGDANVNFQDSSKVEINGNPGTTSPVYIIAHNKDEPFKSDAKIWFSGAVDLNETFVINSLPFRNELESNTYVYIFDGSDLPQPSETPLQSIKFHTSCSQPLLLGDIFGAIQLVGFTDKNGDGARVGVEVKYRYVITNNGTTTAEITTVYDTELGELLADTSLILEPGQSNEGDPIIASAFIRKTTTNVVMVSGNIPDCPLSACTAKDEVSVEILPPSPPRTDLCEDFDKPQKLTMEYVGGDADVNSQDSSKVEISGNPGTASPVFIIAHNKDEPFKSDAKIWFSGAVNLGETFVIDSLPFRDELESNTYVYIFDGKDVPKPSEAPLQSIKFHTSCSQPLFLGDIFGAIQLIGFTDKKGNGSSLP